MILMGDADKGSIERLYVELFGEFKFIDCSLQIVGFMVGRGNIVQVNFTIIKACAAGLHGYFINRAEVNGSNPRFLAGNPLMINQNQPLICNDERIADQLEACADLFLGHQISPVLVHELRNRHL